MLLQSYRIEIFNNKCMPGAISVQCFAHLDQDVSEALPYLNAELGGYEYIEDPPSVTFKLHGKLLTVHGRKINRVWESRETITPQYEGMPRPQMIQILKCLPKTNCRECGEPTCMVFATRIAEGVKDSNDCPVLTPEAKAELDAYIKPYAMDMDGIPW
jgi:ArsR family metal-binding transcriptional regulator